MKHNNYCPKKVQHHQAFYLETLAGDYLKDVWETAAFLSLIKLADVVFDFNGVKCIVAKKTNPSDENYAIFEAKWKLEQKLQWKQYTQSQEYKDQQAKRKAKELELNLKYQRFESLCQFPKFLVVDHQKWKSFRDNNSQDPYSKIVIQAVERVANYFEAQMTPATKPLPLFKECLDTFLNQNNMTGFQSGCVIGILEQVWGYSMVVKSYCAKRGI